jgi:hypothetical protein
MASTSSLFQAFSCGSVNREKNFRLYVDTDMNLQEKKPDKEKDSTKTVLTFFNDATCHKN